MSANAMCKINPVSSVGNHRQREICRQCANWNLEQNQDYIRSVATHKLMTTDECMRLKRTLQATFSSEYKGSNPLTFVLLLFCVVFCMSLACCLLAKAFVFRRPRKCQEEPAHICPERQCGGLTSADDILHQLRAKCTAPSQQLGDEVNPNKELYVPNTFWEHFPLKKFMEKPQRAKSANKLKTETESSAEYADSSNEEETSGEAEQSTYSSDEKSEILTENIEKALKKTCKSIESIGRMPTTYGYMNTNSLEDPKHNKIKWANWLRRKKRNDSNV